MDERRGPQNQYGLPQNQYPSLHEQRGAAQPRPWDEPLPPPGHGYRRPQAGRNSPSPGKEEKEKNKDQKKLNPAPVDMITPTLGGESGNGSGYGGSGPGLGYGGGHGQSDPQQPDYAKPTERRGSGFGGANLPLRNYLSPTSYLSRVLTRFIYLQLAAWREVSSSAKPSMIASAAALLMVVILATMVFFDT